MSKKSLYSFVGVTVASMLLLGIVRAGSSRNEDREKAFLEKCAAERKRLGLDNATLKERYPTPEMGCGCASTIPGGTAEVVARGNFLPGALALFDNEKVEVLKETIVAKKGEYSEYRATIKVPPSARLDVVGLRIHYPVIGGNATCDAVYIGGRYAWDLTADNGWRIKLTPVKEIRSGGECPQMTYRAEFYRSAESKPFEVREASVAGRDTSYGGTIGEPADRSKKLMEAMEKKEGKAEDQANSRRQKELENEMAKLTEKIVKDYANLSEA